MIGAYDVYTNAELRALLGSSLLGILPIYTFSVNGERVQVFSVSVPEQRGY